jgi:hypothetical protein
MSYNTISLFCSATGKSHSLTLTFCLICKSGQEIIDHDFSLSLPPSTHMTQPHHPLHVAATERDIVNSQIRNANSRPHAGSNALSTCNSSRTMQQLFSFNVILILEEFCYSSLEDKDAKLQTMTRCKVQGMIILFYFIMIYF